MVELNWIPDALRMFGRRFEIGLRGIPKYTGSSKKICRSIVNDCWNGRYFQTSTGHFCQFYTRDFGWCVESLIKLGYKDKVRREIQYAMNIFKMSESEEIHNGISEVLRNCHTISDISKKILSTKNHQAAEIDNKSHQSLTSGSLGYKGITTTITKKDIPYDFPCYSPDSLAFFMRALRISDSVDIAEKNKDFLNDEIKKYFDLVIDKDTGLVKKNKIFSSMKDRYFRVSSCYDNVMTAMLKDDISKMKILDNPFKDYNYKKIIRDAFWNGDYFNDDLESNYVSGDANVFPYWTAVFNDKNMIKKSINSIMNDGLDRPFPLKYTSKIPNTKKDFTETFLVPNSEGTCVWTQLGFMYMKVVGMVDKELARTYIQKWSGIIERYKNCIEIFDERGRPYKSLFYHADAGMLWACMFLELLG